MHYKLRVPALCLVVFLILAAGCAPPPNLSQPLQAFVDPQLTPGQPAMSVIVTGAEAGLAARAVSAVGGQVTDDLWLIQAVAATLSSDQVKTLSTTPGIRSLVANRETRSSGSLCPGKAACASRPGWITDRREKTNTSTLTVTMQSPITSLPDGGFLVVGNGVASIMNADWSTRKVTILDPLNQQKFDQPAALGTNGLIYVPSHIQPGQTTNGWYIYALKPSGVISWTFKQGSSYDYVGVTTAPDGTVYAVAGSDLFAIDKFSGKQLWKYTLKGLPAYQPGLIVSIPAVAPNGWVYVTSIGLDTTPTKARGHLTILNPAAGYVSGSWKTDLMVKAIYGADDTYHFTYTPNLAANGFVYVASDKNKVYAVSAASAALQFTATLTGNITTQPVMDAAGNLYLTTDKGTINKLMPSGAQSWVFQNPSGKKFVTSLVFSADGSTLYAATDDMIVYAVDTATGAQKWNYTLDGHANVNFTLDSNGNLYVPSDAKDLTVISPGGVVLSVLPLQDSAKQTPIPQASGATLVTAGDKTIYTVNLMPESWSGQPDVEPTDINRVWKLSSVVPIDVGADSLNDLGITGQNITVTVLDSGVYFDGHVKDILGQNLQNQFLGQVDFVDKSSCVTDKNRNPAYCILDKDHSTDPYGHGSHVAGIIWSQIQDYATGATMGLAPGAKILSVRVLNDQGVGTYANVIAGIQFIVANQATYHVRVLNLSLSSLANIPYFVDPLDRAVEAAWASGIVVLAAAGNSGPGAETITVPGNDPYAITVGALNSNRTSGYWADDTWDAWSATGPTYDGFAKPDILAPGSNIISFMYNDGKAPTDKGNQSATLVRLHPDYSRSMSLFRMNGTSMATAVASGVAALMLQAHPELTPNQVKFRLIYSARPAVDPNNQEAYNTFQQGMGRIWAPDAVQGDFPADSAANADMNINADLAHGFDTLDDLAFHYQGPIQSMTSDDGSGVLYYIQDTPGADGVANLIGLGVRGQDGRWLDYNTFANARMSWAGARMSWAGGLSFQGDATAFATARMSWAGARMSWAGARMSWAGARMSWAGARMSWAGARMSWAGGMSWATARMSWAGNTDLYSSARMSWAGATGLTNQSNASAMTWIDDNWTPPAVLPVQPTPIAAGVAPNTVVSTTQSVP